MEPTEHNTRRNIIQPLLLHDVVSSLLSRRHLKSYDNPFCLLTRVGTSCGISVHTLPAIILHYRPRCNYHPCYRGISKHTPASSIRSVTEVYDGAGHARAAFWHVRELQPFPRGVLFISVEHAIGARAILTVPLENVLCPH